MSKNYHLYLSTACFHADHDQCRRVCKFCESFCVCKCHKDESQDDPEPAKVVTYGIM